MLHWRSPAIATRPGITASTASPRRSGTDRQIPTRSTRTTRQEVGVGSGSRSVRRGLQAGLVTRRPAADQAREPATGGHRADHHQQEHHQHPGVQPGEARCWPGGWRS